MTYFLGTPWESMLKKSLDLHNSDLVFLMHYICDFYFQLKSQVSSNFDDDNDFHGQNWEWRILSYLKCIITKWLTHLPPIPKVLVIILQTLKFRAVCPHPAHWLSSYLNHEPTYRRMLAQNTKYILHDLCSNQLQLKSQQNQSEMLFFAFSSLSFVITSTTWRLYFLCLYWKCGIP